MKKRISALTACILALSLLLAGCGAGRKTQDIRNGGADSANAPGEAYEAEAAPRSDTAFYTAVNKTSYDGKSEVEAPADQSGAADGRKLVKTMAFNIETQDFDKSVADITAMVKASSGSLWAVWYSLMDVKRPVLRFVFRTLSYRKLPSSPIVTSA